MNYYRKEMNTKLIMYLVSICLLALSMISCGNEDAEVFQQVQPSDTTYTFEDLKQLGFKKGKTYKVDELPDAESAYMGFWGLDPYDRHDYEIRIYPSHEIAVNVGKDYADEATGKRFEENRKNQRWKEGVKDRWQAQGITDISGGASRQNNPRPTYPSWVIFGNIVMLCRGLDEEQSLERCDEFIQAITGKTQP